MLLGVILGGLVVANGAMADRLVQSLPMIFKNSTAHYLALESAATAQMKATNGELRVPRGFDRKNGRLDMRTVFEWTAGHFPGSLWYLYEATGDAHFRDRAVVWTELLEPNKTVDTNHDTGFVINCSYGNARRLLKTDRYDAILETAARTLATRFHEGLGLIRSWGAKDDPERFLVIPDNLMNLELLEDVSILRRDAKLDEIAMSHADVTMRHHFKPDGGCYHVLDYDQRTGRVKGIECGQGAGVESTWSRGQSWTIYGYSMMYRMTGFRRYLDQAVRCADFAIDHPNMPADGVPFWDFGNPGEERDSSAAAVMASALLELSTFLPPAEGRRYFEFAVRQLTSLSGPDYFAAPGENGDWLLKHGVGFKPAGTEIDTPLVYGDYYFLEALLRFRKISAERTRLERLASLIRTEPLPKDELNNRCYARPGDNACLGPANVSEAEGFLAEPVPELPDDLYLDYSRTGNRERYQRPYFRRMYMLDTLVAAESQRGDGRYLPKIVELLEATLALKSWILPAHEWRDGFLSNFKGTCLYTDLFGSELAAHLAMTVRMLGDRLDPALVSRIRSEVERRVFTPLRRDIRWPAPDHAEDFDIATRKLDWWLNGRENWNAVCNDNMLVAALGLIDDPCDRALFVDAAIRSVDSYLESFSTDGYCSEGMAYWNYGFGHHLRMGLLLRKASDGKIDVFTRPVQRKAAAYARAFTLAEGVPSAFADGSGAADPRNLALVDEIWPDLNKDLAPADEFEEGQVWIFRDPQGLSVAFKGGHNDELHNHNDLGSYSVAANGSYLSGDPGSEIYTKKTFSEARYESKINGSYGHPVPLVDGKGQCAGRKFAAKVVARKIAPMRAEVALDLSDGYGCPALERLIRTFVYDRTARTFTVRDSVRFRSPTRFEVPYTTFGHPVRVEVNVLKGGPCVRKEEDIPNPERLAPHRVAYAFAEPVVEAEIEFVFH